MGVSTDAILFYGYVWEEEDDELCERVMNESWEQGKDAKVTAGSHCHMNCPMLYVCIAETEVMAYRGSPKRVDDVTARTETGWRALLHDWCIDHNVDITTAQGPSWWLVSDSDF